MRTLREEYLALHELTTVIINEFLSLNVLRWSEDTKRAIEELENNRRFMGIPELVAARTPAESDRLHWMLRRQLGTLEIPELEALLEAHPTGPASTTIKAFLKPAIVYAVTEFAAMSDPSRDASLLRGNAESNRESLQNLYGQHIGGRIPSTHIAESLANEEEKALRAFESAVRRLARSHGHTFDQIEELQRRGLPPALNEIPKDSPLGVAFKKWLTYALYLSMRHEKHPDLNPRDAFRRVWATKPAKPGKVESNPQRPLPIE